MWAPEELVNVLEGFVRAINQIFPPEIVWIIHLAAHVIDLDLEHVFDLIEEGRRKFALRDGVTVEDRVDCVRPGRVPKIVGRVRDFVNLLRGCFGCESGEKVNAAIDLIVSMETTFGSKTTAGLVWVISRDIMPRFEDLGVGLRIAILRCIADKYELLHSGSVLHQLYCIFMSFAGKETSYRSPEFWLIVEAVLSGIVRSASRFRHAAAILFDKRIEYPFHWADNDLYYSRGDPEKLSCALGIILPLSLRLKQECEAAGNVASVFPDQSERQEELRSMRVVGRNFDVMMQMALSNSARFCELLQLDDPLSEVPPRVMSWAACE
jgi:hypothetical protein